MKPVSRPSRIALLGSWSGLIGPLTISLGILISAFAYSGVEGQDYHLVNHFVSELGQVGVSDLAAAFNFALILGGLFNTAFLAWLPFQFQGWIRYTLLLVGVTTAAFGTLVGIFPMNTLQVHIFVALSFFNLGLLTSLIYSVVILYGKSHNLPRWLAIPGFINTITILVFTNFPSQFEEGVDFQTGMRGLLKQRPETIPLAIMEWIVILGVIAWFLTLGIYFLQNHTHQQSHQSACPGDNP